MKSEVLYVDRDGVINRRIEGRYIRDISDLVFEEGVFEAFKELDKQVKHIFIITNQQGVAKGEQSLNDVVRVNQYVIDRIRAESGCGVLRGVFFCPHGEGYCWCRKPCPGMIIRIWNIFPGVKHMRGMVVGDSWRDYFLARVLGLEFVHVRSDSAETRYIEGVVAVRSLLELAEIMKRGRAESQ